jgi:hypothetical protein
VIDIIEAAVEVGLLLVLVAFLLWPCDPPRNDSGPSGDIGGSI